MYNSSVKMVYPAIMLNRSKSAPAPKRRWQGLAAAIELAAQPTSRATSQPARVTAEEPAAQAPATPTRGPAAAVFEEPDPLSPALTLDVEDLEDDAACQEPVRGRTPTRDAPQLAEPPEVEYWEKLEVTGSSAKRRGYSRPLSQQRAGKNDVVDKMQRLHPIQEQEVRFLMDLLILPGPGILYSG